MACSVISVLDGNVDGSKAAYPCGWFGNFGWTFLETPMFSMGILVILLVFHQLQCGMARSYKCYFFIIII